MAEPQYANLTLKVPNKRGKLIPSPVRLKVTDSRIEFLSSPFHLKTEIKSMKGSKWHGFEDPPRKIWSVENCIRNRLQLNYLRGENIYANWDQPLKHHKYTRPLYGHQCDMADHALTYHFSIWAAEMGTGKTLSAIEVMEQSGVKEWFWIGPRSGLNAVEREFKKWNLDPSIKVETHTYEGLVKRMNTWKSGDKPPMGVIYDESSRVKNPKSKRSQAAQKLADGIREEYGMDGYIVLMSGTPSPKSPCDIWSQAEICWPGFLKEGSYGAFEKRLGIYELKESTQGKFYARSTWLDDEDKCAVCGEYKEDHEGADHKFKKSVNEVALLSDRLKGLVNIKFKKDCLDLPEKMYRVVECEPDARLQRVAKAFLKAAPNTITGATWLRELSDGFMYKEETDGTKPCPVCEGSGETHVWVDPEREDRVFEMVDLLEPAEVAKLTKTLRKCPTCKGKGEVPKKVRVTKEIPSPKDEALLNLLEENDEQGRVVIFAAFTGSIDKITKLCLANGWDVARVDGRGWSSFACSDQQQTGEAPLDLWASDKPKVAFVAHPASGGFAVTLTEARMAIFYSNDFNPETRVQAEDRIHRIGLDPNKGATIVDIVNLPTDKHIIEVLKDNRRLELMTLGELETDYAD